jgi:UPF0755 protein
MVYIFFAGYKIFFCETTGLKTEKSIFIATGSTIKDVTDTLLSNKIITDARKFYRHVRLWNYTQVKSGHYVVPPNISYRHLVKMLSIGKQTPVNLVIAGTIRTKEKLAGIVAKQIEADSVALLQLLNDSSFLATLGFKPENSILLFIPNTYNVYWNRNPQQLFKDMKRNYGNFWTPSRTEKLKALGLNREEAMTLASIVIEETVKYDELPRVAGVYVNRLKQGIPLQADPTVKYAVGDFTLKRILNVHTAMESPYNTYLHTGLPPGPICIPQPQAVDAVLNREKHDYLFFCAKDDFSGYHIFAKTLQQHNLNATLYRNALNKRKIY